MPALQAEVLAKGMGVHLGAILYVTNQMSAPQYPRVYAAERSSNRQLRLQPRRRLAIEPRKVSSSANVYVVFSIE